MKKLPGSLKAIIVMLIACIAVAGCGGAESQQDSSGEGPLRVVATYSILGDLVENVGGEEIELTMLVGPNGDAHTFEPAPADNAELSEAGVIFENGLEFETWLDELYESSGSEAERVVVTENLEPLPIAGEGHEGESEHAGEEEHGAEEEHEEHADEEHADEEEHEGEHAGEEEHGEEHADEEHADEHGHEHGESDPHAWHDVGNAMTMVGSIRDALIEADPENAEAYEANARRYFAELEELDAEVTEQAESVPEERRTLFTSHDTFGYFAERYGFEVDTALASASTEASDPSAGETAELIEEIEASGVPAVFAENVSNPEVMERISSEADVELAPPLYTDALGEPGSEGATYIEMERYNAMTIAEALGG